MTCDDVRPRLTAYLDGDLDPDRGTVVRGHLRACAACRGVAEREAALRDGLRALPTLDPPAHLWSNIQAQLAAAEVAEAQRPAWKRALAKWTPMLPRFAVGGVLVAAASGILWWRIREPKAPVVAETKVIDVRSPEIQPARPAMTRAECKLEGPVDADVTDDLAGDAARITACYSQTGTELLALAAEARGTWSEEQRVVFDARVAELRASIDAADEGRAKQRAWRAMNRYLQAALTRDQVALAGVTP